MYLFGTGRLTANPNTIFTITTKLSEVLNKHKKNPQYPFTDIEDFIITIIIIFFITTLYFLYTDLFDRLYSEMYEYFL